MLCGSVCCGFVRLKVYCDFFCVCDVFVSLAGNYGMVLYVCVFVKWVFVFVRVLCVFVCAVRSFV